MATTKFLYAFLLCSKLHFLLVRPAAAIQKVSVPREPLALADPVEANPDVDGDFWQLFPEGKVPGERPGTVGALRDGPPIPEDPVGQRCAPGEHTGRWVYNVTIPGMVARVVPMDQPNRTNVGIIVMPGGGYEFLAWTKEGLEIADWLNSIGISAFVLKYRVPERKWLGERKAAFMDGQRAVSLLRSKATSLGLDPTRIGTIGFSAGGHLSTVVSSMPVRTYFPIDEVDSVSSRPDFQMLVYSTGDPFHGEKPGPTFVAIAENDQCVDTRIILAYYMSLKIKGISAEMHMFPDGGHGYGSCRTYPDKWYEVCTWPSMAKTFIDHEVLHLN